MADPANRELVKRVQSSLSKYVTKPQLTEKLLNKPPFKFLHDIVTNVIQNTNYLSGVFTDEEIISTNVTTKETKIKFLEKLITTLQSTTNKTISAKPSKIVAGLEVTKTLELLLTIVLGIEIKNKEIQEQNSKSKKNVTMKIGSQNKTKVLEKNKSQEKKVKESIDHDFKKNLQKTNSEDSSAVKINKPINMEINSIKKSNLEFSVKPVDEEINKTIIIPQISEEQDKNNDKVQLLITPELQDSELIVKNNEENELLKLSKIINAGKILRPKSSRPPAPNRRPQSNTFTEVPKYSDNFFSKNDDKINDIDDNIVTIEIVPDNKLSYDSFTEGDGHLVSQILQTQLEFNMKNKNNSSKTEWEGKSSKNHEIFTRELCTIRQFIQDITKSANPLSKLINNMQENIDQINRELNYWKTFTEKTNEKVDLQQQVADEKIKPMVTLLEKLKSDIKDELELMDYCKTSIMKNKCHINYLISERFTLKK